MMIAGISLQLLISLMVTASLGAVFYTYVFPWLYNTVNEKTQRGERLDKIDYLNTFIAVLLYNVVFSICVAIVAGIKHKL